LQAKHNALVSSLILGLIWGFWHLPKYLAPGSTGSFIAGMVKILAEAILYTWLYNNTKGSLLLATILHASGNTAGVFLPIANTVSGNNMNVLIIAIALEILAAVLVIRYSNIMSLSRKTPIEKQFVNTGA
jgi:membrane protease YdiL (CAAX protease family)